MWPLFVIAACLLYASWIISRRILFPPHVISTDPIKALMTTAGLTVVIAMALLGCIGVILLVYF